jgi:hypothetical protein
VLSILGVVWSGHVQDGLLKALGITLLEGDLKLNDMVVVSRALEFPSCKLVSLLLYLMLSRPINWQSLTFRDPKQLLEGLSKSTSCQERGDEERVEACHFYHPQKVDFR